MTTTTMWLTALWKFYTSWIDAVLCNYNTDVYYQLREYIYECCKEGQICA